MAEYNSVAIPSTRQSNKLSVSTETKWSRNSKAQTREVCGMVYSQSRTIKRKLFTAANVSKTFKRVNPRKAAGPDGILSHILRSCADQLAGTT